MPVVTCPECEAELELTDQQAARGRVRCPDCGTVVAVAAEVPVAKAARRRAADAPPAPPAPPAQKAEKPAKPRSTLGGCLVILAVAVFGGIYALDRQQAADDLIEADRLYTAGRKAEAVAKYKARYTYAPDEGKPLIVKRVVEFAVESGDEAEARRWVERGLSERLGVAYDSQPARDLHALVAKERAEAEARRKAEQAAREAAQEKARREAEEKDRRYGGSTEATRAVQAIVKGQLAFPAEARFGALGTTTEQNPDGSWKVTGDVTAKNAFGVKVKYLYRAVVAKQQGGDWREVEPVVLLESDR